MSAKPDRRLTPARPDLAAAHLRGVVAAPRYAEGSAMQVVEASAPLRREPAPTRRSRPRRCSAKPSGLRRERRLGVGPARTRRLCRLSAADRARAAGHPHPPGRGAAHARLSALDQAAADDGAVARRAADDGRREGDFAVTADGGYPGRGTWPTRVREPNFVAVAEMFLHAPYLWGGRTSEGIDCSGLVQAALTAAGSPRRATATSWRRRSASRSHWMRRSGAATSCSGKAMSG